MKKKFPCTKCGVCCTRIGFIVENLRECSDPNSKLYFPYEFDEKGVCSKLVDNKCSVYENRPTLCNVEKMFDRKHNTWDEFVLININACNQMMDEVGVDEEFRIKID